MRWSRSNLLWKLSKAVTFSILQSTLYTSPPRSLASAFHPDGIPALLSRREFSTSPIFPFGPATSLFRLLL